MRAWCPHCGALNEFVRPPTTAIVYCQHCRKPFGAAALTGAAATGTPSAVRSPSNPPQARPVSSPGTPPKGVPKPQSPVDYSREPTRPFTGSPTHDRAQPVSAAQVIVPKGRHEKAGEGPLARVVYHSPDGLETDFVLDENNTVGRHPKNKIRLNDREISKEHAIIELRNNEWWIRDLKSSNGTYVGNKRISESQLTDGDDLMLGSMRLQFIVETPGETDSRTSVRDLVTILPQDPAGATHIHATLEEEEEQDFSPVDEVKDVDILKRDYEKLRITYELSSIGLTMDLSELLTKTLDAVFDMLPADNGVILLVDEETNMLVPHTVKQRLDSPQEILLSSTIVNQVLQERASVLSSDAFLDPRFSGSQSIIAQGIRAAMCVPLVAHDKVVGMMHLDSRERVGAFTEKDLSLLKAIAAQTAVAIENTRLVRQIEQEAQTRGQLNRFLPPHVVEEMVHGKGQAIQKGGRELQASVVFCDIRGFTSLSESSGPQEVVDLLNDYFERLVEVVFKRHGVLDKFIGDALMASWGTLEAASDPTFNCVAAGIEFRDAIRDLNLERQEEGLDQIGMGVGVNTGRLVAGYMGSKRRLEYTVIGDTVNTASRICGIAQGDQVLISDSTYRAVADRIEARYLGTRQVKGKEQEVGVYEALSVLG